MSETFQVLLQIAATHDIEDDIYSLPAGYFLHTCSEVVGLVIEDSHRSKVLTGQHLGITANGTQDPGSMGDSQLNACCADTTGTSMH